MPERDSHSVMKDYSGRNGNIPLRIVALYIFLFSAVFIIATITTHQQLIPPFLH